VTRLDGIRGPADLRPLDMDDLDELAADIRRTIIDTVTRTGGHLGSNLGVVELTLALHRVFESPRDAIVWDTGHQAYPHKLVTGRRGDFATLRSRGGLSGYPNRGESPHDLVENSHASTALSYAFGIALADRLRGGGTRRVAAVVGDGALTGGMAFEALNNIGYRGVPVVIVLNDNGRSYAPTVSRLGESLSPLPLDPAANRRRRAIDQALVDADLDDAARARLGDALDPISAASVFGALGLRYLGPFDGHDVLVLETALAKAAEMGEPVVVHVLTRKGWGYPPAEDDDATRLHDVPRADGVGATASAARRRRAPARPRRYTDVFGDAIVRAARDDPTIVAVTAAMTSSTGLLAFEREFPDRLLDVGIAEQHAVTAAAGLAMSGAHPVVAIYSTFLTRAFDQVNLDVGLHRAPVVFCVDRAGITGPDGPSHHGLLDLALLTKVPGMTVLAPSSAPELEVMLQTALARREGPTALRWPNGPARTVADHEVGAGLAARRIRHGADVCLLAVGRMVEAAEGAAARLGATGVAASVWDVRAVTPLDPAMLLDAVAHPAVVTIEDGVREGGAGSHIAHALRRLPHGDALRLRCLGVPVQYVAHGDPVDLLAELGLGADGIAGAARALVG
jgi:1-deoxy-D-xylulose-5-phosphate synthase